MEIKYISPNKFITLYRDSAAMLALKDAAEANAEGAEELEEFDAGLVHFGTIDGEPFIFWDPKDAGQSTSSESLMIGANDLLDVDDPFVEEVWEALPPDSADPHAMKLLAFFKKYDPMFYTALEGMVDQH